MAAVTQAAPPSDPPEYTFTLDQYHRMIDAKIITEEDRVEFIEGVLVPKMTRKPPHDSCLDRLEDALRALLPARWRVRSQKAITLTDGEPEPDVAVVLGPASRYDDHHPGPAVHDFDFYMGTWQVHHRRLKERLCGSHEWQEFEGKSRAGVPSLRRN